MAVVDGRGLQNLVLPMSNNLRNLLSVLPSQVGVAVVALGFLLSGAALGRAGSCLALDYSTTQLAEQNEQSQAHARAAL